MGRQRRPFSFAEQVSCRFSREPYTTIVVVRSANQRRIYLLRLNDPLRARKFVIQGALVRGANHDYLPLTFIATLVELTRLKPSLLGIHRDVVSQVIVLFKAANEMIEWLLLPEVIV